MTQRVLVLPALMLSLFCSAQIKVESEPGTDFSRYKTFMFGEGEIITPKDLRQVPDSTLHKWVKGAIQEEFRKKGLKQVTVSPDLIVSYITGTQTRSDAGDVGPLGLTPGGNTTQTYLRDYRQGSLVIDLNDQKNSKLVWRVNAMMNTNNPDAKQSIDQIVVKGFKKFSIKPKREKKKK